MTLKINVGTVNYTDYLHVTVAKVSAPSIIIWENWIDVPVTNYTFIIPDLDPEVYYVTYYDAPDITSLGTVVMQQVVQAQTGNVVRERKFYTCGDGGVNPVDGDVSLTDPYLISKEITGVFKEGYRYYEPDIEWTFDGATGKISLINGTAFSEGEKFIVEINYNQEIPDSPTSDGGGLYKGILTITDATYTINTGDVGKRIRLNGSGITQVITLPALSSFASGNGLYLDNSVGGTAAQVKLLLPGTDKIRFSGFGPSFTQFSEFWVSRGEHLLIRKFNDSYWEVITDYAGVHVGEKVTLGYGAHPNTLPEDGRLIDGDEYPRLWWWLNNVLPATHQYIDDNVVSDILFIASPSKIGQFAKHSTLKKFRMPNTQALSERGLKSFVGSGTDSTRSVNYPGGYQEEKVGRHQHQIKYFWDNRRGSNSSSNYGAMSFITPNEIGGHVVNKTGISEYNGNEGDVNTVKNTGVIYARRI